MFDLPLALLLTVTDKIFGSSPENDRYLAESRAMNQADDVMCLNFARATTAMMNQQSISMELYAFERETENLKRLRELQAERKKLLGL